MKVNTAIGAALKDAVQKMSNKKQTDIISEYIYNKFAVFSRTRPLALGIEQELVEALPQFDEKLVLRVLATHCRRPKYIKAVARGGKRFGLNGKPKGEVSEQEQAHALQQPGIKEAIAKQDARIAEMKAKQAAQKQAAEAKASSQAPELAENAAE